MTIAQLQGTTDTSPYAGKNVTTDGVVTAVYGTGGFNGYTIQTPGTGGAIDLAAHTASDAVFVFSSATAGLVHEGDHVRVTGAVSEYFGLTELTVSGASSLQQLDDTVAAPQPAAVAFPSSDAQRESLESMLVAPQGAYTVADNYTTNQYGEVVLASGTKRLIQPTEVGRPGSAAAKAVEADNAARKVTLDDGASTNFLTAGEPGHPGFVAHPGPGHRRGRRHLHRAGRPGLPQQRVEVPADRADHGRDPGRRPAGVVLEGAPAGTAGRRR